MMYGAGCLRRAHSSGDQSLIPMWLKVKCWYAVTGGEEPRVALFGPQYHTLVLQL